MKVKRLAGIAQEVNSNEFISRPYRPNGNKSALSESGLGTQLRH